MSRSEAVSVLLGLIDVLETPGAVDRGFAEHLIATIDDVLRDLGHPRRSGAVTERMAAIAAIDASVAPPAAI